MHQREVLDTGGATLTDTVHIVLLLWVAEKMPLPAAV
jgi:hypothetical protein